MDTNTETERGRDLTNKPALTACRRSAWALSSCDLRLVISASLCAHCVLSSSMSLLRREMDACSRAASLGPFSFPSSSPPFWVSSRASDTVRSFFWRRQVSFIWHVIWIFLSLLREKPEFEHHKNMPASADISRLVVHVWDVINKTSICGSVYITSWANPFLLQTGKE